MIKRGDLMEGEGFLTGMFILLVIIILFYILIANNTYIIVFGGM